MPRDIFPSDIDPVVIAYDSFVAAHRAYESASAAEDAAFVPEPRVVLYECAGAKNFVTSQADIDEWARKRSALCEATIKEIRRFGLGEQQEAETIAFAEKEMADVLGKAEALKAELRQRKAEHTASGAPAKMKTLKREADAALKAERKAMKDLLATRATTTAGILAKLSAIVDLDGNTEYEAEFYVAKIRDELEAIERRRNAD